MKTLKIRLEEDRAVKGVNASKQAELMGLSAGHLSRLCNGKMSLSAGSAAKIASYLGIAPEELAAPAPLQETLTKARVLITSDEFVFLSKASDAMGMPLSLSLTAEMVMARRKQEKK